MLEKKVFHDDFYNTRLRPLCRRLGERAFQVLSTGEEEQVRHQTAATKHNSKLDNAPARVGETYVAGLLYFL